MRIVKIGQSKRARKPFKSQPKPPIELPLLMRGRIILWTSGGDFAEQHYWIIVSRDEINFTIKSDSEGHMPPMFVVPINSYRGVETPVGASDILIEDESKFKFPAERPAVVRCGLVRPWGRKRAKAYEGSAVCDELLAEIDKKLAEVFGLEEYIDRLIQSSLEVKR